MINFVVAIGLLALLTGRELLRAYQGAPVVSRSTPRWVNGFILLFLILFVGVIIYQMATVLNINPVSLTMGQ